VTLRAQADELLRKADTLLAEAENLETNVAYTMAQADKNLPLSLEYAQKAVKDEEEASANVTLSSLKLDDLARMSRLSAYWDTLGWVYFKMGNLDQAHKYVDAAVQLSANKTKKEHLDEIGGKSSPHLKSRLDNSGEGRSIKLSRLVPGTASADFFVVLRQVPGTSDGRIDEVKFIKGSDELNRPATSSSRQNSIRSFLTTLPPDSCGEESSHAIPARVAHSFCSMPMTSAPWIDFCR
jgi:tetratricopeptide (TPR) repeat protein